MNPVHVPNIARQSVDLMRNEFPGVCGELATAFVTALDAASGAGPFAAVIAFHQARDISNGPGARPGPMVGPQE